MRNLTHIVPCLPPAINGVGDYSVKLWSHWYEPQQKWCFLVTEGASASQKQWSEVRIENFEKSTRGLISALEAIKAQTVILHYVGYGFHPKGCPVWLPLALKEWKADNLDRQVVVMFHETYATGAIWKSSFWLQPIAQKIIRNLILIADLWSTSCRRYYSQLVSRFAANPKQGALIPIGTNIVPVEPVLDRPWSLFKGEKLKVVIFGLTKTRLWALNVHAKFLKALCDRNWVESITLAGTSEIDTKTAKKMAQHRTYIGHAHLWQEAFDLTNNQVSQLLVTQDLGLVSNEPDILTKSGVFAALSAHGVLSAICGQTDRLDNDWDRSVFVYKSRSKISECLEQMQDQLEVERKKLALRSLIQTQLDWNKIALAWGKHLEQIGN